MILSIDLDTLRPSTIRAMASALAIDTAQCGDGPTDIIAQLTDYLADLVGPGDCVDLSTVLHSLAIGEVADTSSFSRKSVYNFVYNQNHKPNGKKFRNIYGMTQHLA